MAEHEIKGRVETLKIAKNLYRLDRLYVASKARRRGTKRPFDLPRVDRTQPLRKCLAELSPDSLRTPLGQESACLGQGQDSPLSPTCFNASGQRFQSKSVRQNTGSDFASSATRGACEPPSTFIAH